MNRTLAVTVFVVLNGALCQAGEIQIGQNIDANTGSSSNGLTKAYITGSTPCAGAQLVAGTACATGSVGTGALERNFDPTLFSGVLNANSTAQTAPKAGMVNSEFSGYLANYDEKGNPISAGPQPANAKMSDGNVSFAMLADSASSTSNFWDLAANNSANSMVVPIGISGVSQVWTMMNDLFGLKNNTNVKVTFNFGTTSNGAVNANGTGGSTLVTPVVVTLGGGDLIRSAVDCTGSGTGGGTNKNNGGCPAYATTLSSSTTLTGSANSYGSNVTGITGGTLSVSTNNLYSSAYTGSSPSATDPSYNKTSGTVVLDDQGFDFGSLYTSDYLVSIVFTEMSGAMDISRLGLTGITLLTSASQSTSATPEPSTWIMLATGIGIFGFFARRRKVQAS